jgi:hypothetical protein
MYQLFHKLSKYVIMARCELFGSLGLQNSLQNPVCKGSRQKAPTVECASQLSSNNIMRPPTQQYDEFIIFPPLCNNHPVFPIPNYLTYLLLFSFHSLNLSNRANEEETKYKFCSIHIKKFGSEVIMRRRTVDSRSFVMSCHGRVGNRS